MRVLPFLPPKIEQEARMPNIERILRCKDVMALTGLSRSTLYAMMSEGAFPPSIKLSKRAVGWREAAIKAWMDAR